MSELREAFELAYEVTHKPIIKRPYPRCEDGTYFYSEIHQAYELWEKAQQAAAPSVPDGYVHVGYTSESSLELFQRQESLASMTIVNKSSNPVNSPVFVKAAQEQDRDAWAGLKPVGKELGDQEKVDG